MSGRKMRVGIAAAMLALPACARKSDDARADSRVGADQSVRMHVDPATTHTAKGGGKLRVMFVGTSLTAGLGLDPDSAYPALIQRLADSAGYRIDVTNAGLSGETSAGALRRVDWLLRDTIDVLVLETGANDGLRGLAVDSSLATIRAILTKVRAAHPLAPLLLVQMEAPPNLGARYTSAFHGMYPTLARELGITLVPFLLDSVAARPELNQGDGIHPNEAGERIVARTMWRALQPTLDSLGGRGAALPSVPSRR